MQGVPPATVAEWTLDGDGNRDFYDGNMQPLCRLSAFTDYVLPSVPR